MNIKLLTAVSALVLIGAAPVYADSGTGPFQTAQAATSNNPDTPDMPAASSEDIKKGWQNVKDTTNEAYNNIKAAFIDGEAEGPLIVERINQNTTATGMLGKSVRNTAGEKVGNIDDIILMRNGKAETVVISHGGFLGLGSENAAFDYDRVVKSATDGDVIVPLSEQALEEATAFSYDRDQADEGMAVVPENHMRVSQLLESDVSNVQGEVVADTENIHFHNGQAAHLIVSPKEMFEINEERLALDYDQLRLSQTDFGNYRFQMNSSQSNRLEQFRKGKHISAAEYTSIEPAAGNPRANVHLNTRGIRLVQDTLNDRGYSSGPEDGIMGPKTRSALREFQRDNNLPVTGTPTQQTLSEMNIQLQYD